jgi:hypothetical protein
MSFGDLAVVHPRVNHGALFLAKLELCNDLARKQLDDMAILGAPSTDTRIK